MNSKYLTYIVLIFFAILEWNVFLIQRDQKLFDAYDNQRLKSPLSSSIETWCKRQEGWHPDCNSK